MMLMWIGKCHIQKLKNVQMIWWKFGIKKYVNQIDYI